MSPGHSSSSPHVFLSAERCRSAASGGLEVYRTGDGARAPLVGCSGLLGGRAPHQVDGSPASWNFEMARVSISFASVARKERWLDRSSPENTTRAPSQDFKRGAVRCMPLLDRSSAMVTRGVVTQAVLRGRTHWPLPPQASIGPSRHTKRVTRSSVRRSSSPRPRGAHPCRESSGRRGPGSSEAMRTPRYRAHLLPLVVHERRGPFSRAST